ncbi:MAG: hypothetical protein WAT41_05610 [Flavobacteriales bacterium]
MRIFQRAALFAIALFSLAGTVRAQTTPTTGRSLFEEASLLMEEKFYNQAAERWLQLVGQNPLNSNYNWKLGEAYMNSYNQKSKALPYLKVAAEQRGASQGGFNTVGYDPFDPKEKNAPPQVDYWLGKAYHLNGEFDKADEYYRKFIAESEPKNDFHPLAQRGLEETASARILTAHPGKFNISNVGPVINSEYPDFSPVISVDGNALFFTSRRVRPDSSNVGIIDPIVGLPYENIFVSYKDRVGNWQQPEALNIDPPEGHLASVNVSADGQTLVIYRDDQGDGNLYESKLVGELWSDPVKMGSDINTKSWETHGALSADGNTFYFVSNRPGGYGGRDIYRVVKLPTGEWSKAQNIGNVVNTAYEEDAVFIHPNGRTMYFASTGHNSMGGFDIFTTELQADGTWSQPKNIGYPLNTVDDDIFFVTTADGRRGYFSSDKAGGFGEKDIYFVDFPEEMGAEGLAVLKGFIVPPPGEQLSPTTILYVTDKETGEVKSYKPRQRDGVYVAILPPCKNYNLDYRVDDKTIHTEDIFVECESAYQEINKEVYLNPVSLSGPADIKNLPDGASPGAKEKGVPVAQEEGAAMVPGLTGSTKNKVDADKAAAEKQDLTDAQRKEMGEKHVTPEAKFSAVFTKYYPYNAQGIDGNDPEWKDFINKVSALIEKDGNAKITIEACASHVPTRTFGTNEKLSNLRMEAARKSLLDAIKAAGKNTDALLLESVNHLVQGPKYEGDWKNTDKYSKFQFVKLKVK